MAGSPTASPRKKWIEPIVALALTTLSTAGCSYESAAWTRRSNLLMNESSTLERSAALLEVQGSQRLIIHTSMFMQLLAAQHAGNEQLAAFYAEGFAPDMKKAYEAWLAQKSSGKSAAAPHPFVPEFYEVRGTSEAAAARASAAQQAAEARVAGVTSGQYLANTVIFATALCLTVAAGSFDEPRARLLATILGVAVLAFAIARTLLLPIA